MPESNRFFPKRLDAHHWARNGFVPQAKFINNLAGGLNHCQSYRRKSWGSSGANVTVTGYSGTKTIARWRCHSGIGATNLVVVLTMGLCDGSVSTPVAPRVDVNAKVSGGATTTESIAYGMNANTAVTDAPNELAYFTVRVPISGDTDLECSIDTYDYARVLGWSAYEEASSEADVAVDHYTDSSAAAVAAPIVDITRQEILLGLSQLWRRNGAHLLTWPGETTAPTNSTVTWTNVIDSTTAVAASSAGWHLGDGSETLETLCRLSGGGTFTAVLAVHCSVTTGATGEVRLESSGGTVASITGMGTGAGWYTANVVIDATALASAGGRVDIQFRTSSNGNLVTLNSVCLYTLA